MEGSRLVFTAIRHNKPILRTFAWRAAVAVAFLLFAPAVDALTGPVVYSQNFEGALTGWTLDPPWGVTTSDHVSGTHSLTDSPAGLYGNNVDASAKVQVDLTAGGRPLLKFWQKDLLESYADFGYVEVSTNGATWTPVFFAAGLDPTWREQKIDLSEYAYQTPWVRFRLVTNSTEQYDGWYIDDVQVENNTATVAYPFFDNMEGAENWIGSTWKRTPASAYSPTQSWTDSPGGNSVEGVTSSLVLSGTIDLSGAVNPQLSFWQWIPDNLCRNWSSVCLSSAAQVSVSGDGGLHWTKLAQYSAPIGPTPSWSREQLYLSGYAGLPQRTHGVW